MGWIFWLELCAPDFLMGWIFWLPMILFCLGWWNFEVTEGCSLCLEFANCDGCFFSPVRRLMIRSWDMSWLVAQQQWVPVRKGKNMPSCQCGVIGCSLRSDTWKSSSLGSVATQKIRFRALEYRCDDFCESLWKLASWCSTCSAEDSLLVCFLFSVWKAELTTSWELQRRMLA